jgi:uncharacterized protein YceK
MVKRVLFVLAFLLIVVSGCKTVASYRDDYSACLADTECHAKMLALSAKTQAAVTAAAAVVPGGFPLENVLAQLFGMLASGLGGIMYGRKLRSVRSSDK